MGGEWGVGCGGGSGGWGVHRLVVLADLFRDLRLGDAHRLHGKAGSHCVEVVLQRPLQVVIDLVCNDDENTSTCRARREATLRHQSIEALFQFCFCFAENTSTFRAASGRNIRCNCSIFLLFRQKYVNILGMAGVNLRTL